MTNCKNCGAPLQGGKCEYCGTEYDTFRRAPINPRIYPRSISAHEDMVHDAATLYADNQPILTVNSLWLDDLNEAQLDFITKRLGDVLSARETRGVLYR